MLLHACNVGGIEEGSITFAPCISLVDEWVAVDEEEIAVAIVTLKRKEGLLVEGSAGVAIAAFLKTKEKYEGKSVVMVCCGGNISQQVYAKAEQLADSRVC